MLKTIISPRDHQLRVKRHSHAVDSATVYDVTGLSEPTGSQLSHLHTGTSPDSLGGPRDHSEPIVLSHGTHETQPCEPDSLPLPTALSLWASLRRKDTFTADPSEKCTSDITALTAAHERELGDSRKPPSKSSEKNYLF